MAGFNYRIIPNIITVTRILLVIPVAYCLFIQQYAMAFYFFSVIGKYVFKKTFERKMKEHHKTLERKMKEHHEKLMKHVKLNVHKNYQLKTR